MPDLIIPNTYIKPETPLVFLAGPIHSAPNWQDDAVQYLFSKRKDLTIASPRRGVREPIAGYVVVGDEPFSRQRAWERHYLNLAARTGAILFWLPGEAEHKCEKVYGAMTRLELGQWMTRYSQDNMVGFCVGSDGKFPELSPIAFDLSIDAPEKKINKTLEATCDEALRLLDGSQFSRSNPANGITFEVGMGRAAKTTLYEMRLSDYNIEQLASVTSSVHRLVGLAPDGMVFHLFPNQGGDISSEFRALPGNVGYWAYVGADNPCIFKKRQDKKSLDRAKNELARRIEESPIYEIFTGAESKRAYVRFKLVDY